MAPTCLSDIIVELPGFAWELRLSYIFRFSFISFGTSDNVLQFKSSLFPLLPYRYSSLYVCVCTVLSKVWSVPLIVFRSTVETSH